MKLESRAGRTERKRWQRRGQSERRGEEDTAERSGDRVERESEYDVWRQKNDEMMRGGGRSKRRRQMDRDTTLKKKRREAERQEKAVACSLSHTKK